MIDIEDAEVVEALLALTDEIFAEYGIEVDEKGEYYYETENVKRWNLGSGGKAGNCETCIENNEMDWIPDDEVFLDVDGDAIDGPPAHFNCEESGCELEYKEKRVRVYL